MNKFLMPLFFKCPKINKLKHLELAILRFLPGLDSYPYY